MKNYKKILVLVMMVFLCGSCDDDSVLLRSYVTAYMDCPIVLYCGDGREKNQITFHYSGGSNVDGETSKVYNAPELRDEGNDKFLEIAERNGDRSYNRKEFYSTGIGRSAYAHNFKSMEVVCTNAAWDDAHPTGTPLNDLMTIEYRTYKEFIRSGYKAPEGGSSETRKALADLKEDDLAMLMSYNDLYFDKLPVAGLYNIKVTMITTENIEKVATCTFMVE